jgi:hypothetical protein
MSCVETYPIGTRFDSSLVPKNLMHWTTARVTAREDEVLCVTLVVLNQKYE